MPLRVVHSLNCPSYIKGHVDRLRIRGYSMRPLIIDFKTESQILLQNYVLIYVLIWHVETGWWNLKLKSLNSLLGDLSPSCVLLERPLSCSPVADLERGWGLGGRTPLVGIQFFSSFFSIQLQLNRPPPPIHPPTSWLGRIPRRPL